MKSSRIAHIRNAVSISAVALEIQTMSFNILICIVEYVGAL